VTRRKSQSPHVIETVVTYLEMTADPHNHVPPPANLKLTLLKTEKPPLHYYRYLYDIVGREFYWIDRRRMTDDQLAAEIQSEGVDIYVLYIGGVPAGFFEVDHRRAGEVELKYFGLAPEFRGRGLGKWLLNEAVVFCWSWAPSRVIVETCTLDSPAALPLYQRMGFTPYDRQSKVLTLPSS
jgi:GNAT superfamily N-acetyltransferase